MAKTFNINIEKVSKAIKAELKNNRFYKDSEVRAKVREIILNEERDHMLYLMNNKEMLDKFTDDLTAAFQAENA